MAKKNFDSMSAEPVYSTINEATAEARETVPVRKERRTYSEQEAYELMKEMKTSGRKGVKMPRINIAFQPDVYQYVTVMSRVRGDNLTEFVNLALRQHMEDHSELYNRAMEFRRELDEELKQ